MTVRDNTGNLLGYIVQICTWCRVMLKIKNAAGQTVLWVVSPLCVASMCGKDVKFKVMSRDLTVQIGTISKQWSGLFNEMFTDADHFCISFPMDLDVNIKAVLIGALFLIVSCLFIKCSVSFLFGCSTYIWLWHTFCFRRLSTSPFSSC